MLNFASARKYFEKQRPTEKGAVPQFCLLFVFNNLRDFRQFDRH